MASRSTTDRTVAAVPRRPGRPARTDRAQVIAAAADLAAAGGLADLTMARAARAAGLSEMGLYRHVANRDQLVELVVDAVLGRIVPDEVATPARRGEVRGALIDLGHRLVDGLAGYPDVAAHLSVHGPRGPAGLRVMGTILRLLAAAGVPPDLLAFAHGHYTSTVCSVAIFRQHVAIPGRAAWGSTARERLTGAEWVDDPALGGVADRYTGDVAAYQRYAIEHCADAVLADAVPRRRSARSDAQA